MSQIYNGSFVLGDTSATTLSAGPGIKLDTSVPGVIGISNDETILWSGDTPTSAAILSEPASGFERVKILIGNGAGFDTYKVWHEVQGSCVDTPVLRAKGGTNVWWSWIRLRYNDSNNSYYISNSKSFNFGNSTATAWSNPSVSVNNTEDINCLYKVIGINRKEA